MLRAFDFNAGASSVMVRMGVIFSCLLLAGATIIAMMVIIADYIPATVRLRCAQRPSPVEFALPATASCSYQSSHQLYLSYSNTVAIETKHFCFIAFNDLFVFGVSN